MLTRIFSCMGMLIVAPTLYGQSIFENLILDSAIVKHKIRKVTEHGYSSIHNSTPSWTTIEVYDTIGRKMHETSINYTYHKFVCDIEYSARNGKAKVVEKFYDWDPYRKKKKGDTLLKTTVKIYNLNSILSGIDDVPPQVLYDSIGRFIQRIDSIKCGYHIVNYNYDSRGNVIERKHFNTQHGEPPHLFSIDSLTYDESGLVLKEINYFSNNSTTDKFVFDRVVEKVFKHDSNGLVIEKYINRYYLSLPDSKLDPDIYKYTYEFY